MGDDKVQVAIFQKAKKRNPFCGDSYFYTETENGFICAIADGLGSGEFAKESSQIVIDIIRNNNHTSIEQLVQKSNEQLLGKRGVVLGILRLNYHTRDYSFSSIGNIGVMTITKNGKKERTIPNTGYLAGFKQSFKVIRKELEPEMNFIMFSDGVTDKDLQQRFLRNKNVVEVTKSYAHICSDVRDDDTTLIAIRYETGLK